MRILIFSLLAITFFFLFYKLSSPELVRWDEFTNAQVIEQSLKSDQPWILKLDGQPFFEKPPVWYYTTMISVEVFGFNRFALRLVTATSGIVVIWLVYKIGAQVFSQKTGILASLLMLTIPQLFFFNHAGFFSTHTFKSADLDTLQILFILASVYSYYLWQKGKQKYIYFAVAFAALAFMAKGLFGVIPLLICFLYSVVTRQKIPALTIKTTCYLGILFLSIVLPWHIYLYLMYQDQFLTTYLKYHVFQRVVSTLEGHNEPWWFYLQVLFSQSISLSVGVITGLAVSIINKNKLTSSFLQYLVVCLTIILLITLTQTKLAWYILPLYPFLSICIGHIIADLANQPKSGLKYTGLLFIVGIIIEVALNFYRVLTI